MRRMAVRSCKINNQAYSCEAHEHGIETFVSMVSMAMIAMLDILVIILSPFENRSRGFENGSIGFEIRSRLFLKTAFAVWKSLSRSLNVSLVFSKRVPALSIMFALVPSSTSNYFNL